MHDSLQRSCNACRAILNHPPLQVILIIHSLFNTINSFRLMRIGYIQQQQQQQAFASRRLSHPVALTTSTTNTNKLGNDSTLGDHRLFHPLMPSDVFGGSTITPSTTHHNGRPRSVIEGSGYLLRAGGANTTWGGGGDLGIQSSMTAGSASMSSCSSGARASVGSIGDRRPRPQSVDISAWTKRPDLTSAMGRDEKKNVKSTQTTCSSSLDKNHDTSSTSSSSSSSHRGSTTTSASNNNNKKPTETSIDLKELEGME